MQIILDSDNKFEQKQTNNALEKRQYLNKYSKTFVTLKLPSKLSIKILEYQIWP